MKIISIICSFLFVFTTWSQHMYSSLSAGYLYSSPVNQAPDIMINSIHLVSFPWFVRMEDLSFKNNTHADLSFGHFITKNFGYEISGSYLKPMNVVDQQYSTTYTLSGNFYQASAKILLSVPFKKMEVYTKLGATVASGKMTYHQRYYEPSSPTMPIDEATMTYEYTQDVSVGFSGAFGINIPVSKRFSFYSELTYLNQVFSPTKGNMTAHTVDGEDQMHFYSDPYYSQIDFGDDANYHLMNGNNSEAQKLHLRNYSIGGIGLTVGARFIIWNKKPKKEETDLELPKEVPVL